MKIGSTTGFTKSMVDVLLEDAKKQGYVPDASVAGDEVSTETRKHSTRMGTCLGERGQGPYRGVGPGSRMVPLLPSRRPND